jgi:hypothetical protein
VTRVAWEDAAAFAAWAAGKRLPTTAEWTAARERAGSNGLQGRSLLDGVREYVRASAFIALVVGTFEPGKSATGAYDLARERGGMDVDRRAFGTRPPAKPSSSAEARSSTGPPRPA